MVSTQPLAAALLGGRDVATHDSTANFERLSALFELGAERSAVAVAMTGGLAALPGLAGALAHRWEFAVVDLTSDGDPYVDLDELPRARLLLGLSLLSPDRLRTCLGRLNRGRDRIHALGLHLVLVIDAAALLALHEHAPDFSNRVHEILEFDADEFIAAPKGVLSPLGPVRRPGPDEGSVLQPKLMDALAGLGVMVTLRDRASSLVSTAADVAWSFADRTDTWVAWIERERWDDACSARWLRELEDPRLLVVFGGREGFEVSSKLASVLWCTSTSTPVRTWVEMTTVVDTFTNEGKHEHKEPMGGLIWLLYDDVDQSLGTALGHALFERGLTVMSGGPFKLRAAKKEDVWIALLSPAALHSPAFFGTMDMLRPREQWRPKLRSIVILDRVDSATARNLVGSEAVLLTLRSPNETADDIARVLQIPRSDRRLPAVPVKPAVELVVGSDALRLFVRTQIATQTLSSWTRELDTEGDLVDLLPPDALTQAERVVLEFGVIEQVTAFFWPWERLWAATSSPGISVIRRLIEIQPPPMRSQVDTLRVLLVVARPKSLPRLDPRVSVAAISEAIAGIERVDFHVLVRPSFSMILETIRNAHAHGRAFQILHLDAFASASEHGGPSLSIDDDDDPWVWAADLAWTLREQDLCSCILDLCCPEPFIAITTSIARDFLRAHVDTVVATGLDISPVARHVFLTSLYAAIAAGKTIEDAMSVARSALSNDSKGSVAPLLFEIDGGSLQPLVPNLGVASLAELDDDIPTCSWFIGRFSELLELDDILQRHEIVVIHGIEGIGKTSLAAEFARWQRQMRRFDHVIWLAARDAGTVAKRLAERLLPDWDGDETLLREILRVRRVLLVLDGWNTQDPEIVEQWTRDNRLRCLLTAPIRPEQQSWFGYQLIRTWDAEGNP